MVTGETLVKARRLGLDLQASLRHNDSYRCLAALEGLVFTGPTGTNLNDLVVGLKYP
jgi:hydroxypyruvate reductase